MAASNIPPEDRPMVGPFEPENLDRTIIAIPLLKEMEEELENIEKVPVDLRKEFSTAFVLNPDFPGGLQNALQVLQGLSVRAAKRAMDAAFKKVMRFEDEHHTEEEIREEKDRRKKLKDGIKEQRLREKLLEVDGFHLALGVFHAAVLRNVLLLDKQQAAMSKHGVPVVLNVYPKRFEIIIDLNLEHPGGREAARKWVQTALTKILKDLGIKNSGQEVHADKSRNSKQYLFASLEARVIKKLVEMDLAHAEKEVRGKESAGVYKGRTDHTSHRAIYHIWPDFEVSGLTFKSIATVKADAAQVSFSARGNGITWAVMDSGINASHRHFQMHKNIVDTSTQWHKDFTTAGDDPLTDENGHGTHVAGILAGEWRADPGTAEDLLPVAVSRYRTSESKDVQFSSQALNRISGMAPECKLVSLKVLDEYGKGKVSNLIAAITHIQEINGYGRRLLIHGVNMSLGYNFEPEWFACGQSPLCVEVDRLVKSGVVVVVAAGNTGYGNVQSQSKGATPAGLGLTINDPGNADLAITVGATHRDMPHMYGVSYFSSKGPTGDGRMKPDLVAPGEKIISCATGELKSQGGNGANAGKECEYVENSGTSMAAPHVSGAIAAFLSVRREFIGRPEQLEAIFTSTATDLKRDRYFQGAGLIDLMRAIQSV